MFDRVVSTRDMSKGASIYDVRTEGGGGYPKRRCSKGGCVNLVSVPNEDKGGGQKLENFADVIYGRSLSEMGKYVLSRDASESVARERVISFA